MSPEVPKKKVYLASVLGQFIAVVFFIFQEDFAAGLDAWLIGLVAWGGVMLALLLDRKALARQPREAL